MIIVDNIPRIDGSAISPMYAGTLTKHIASHIPAKNLDIYNSVTDVANIIDNSDNVTGTQLSKIIFLFPINRTTLIENMDASPKDINDIDVSHDSWSGFIGISESSATNFGITGESHTFNKPSSKHAIVAETKQKCLI